MSLFARKLASRGSVLTNSECLSQSYTIWLVVPDADSPGNPYDWKKKIEGLETGAHYESLSPSYTFNVPSNISTSGYVSTL